MERLKSRAWGWVKKDFEEINRRMAEAGKIAKAVVFKPGKMCATSARVEGRKTSAGPAPNPKHSPLRAERNTVTRAFGHVRVVLSSVGGCTLVHSVCALP